MDIQSSRFSKNLLLILILPFPDDPQKTLQLVTGQLCGGIKQYTWTINHQDFHKSLIDFDIDFDIAGFPDDPQRTIQMFGQLVTDRLLQVEVYSNTDRQRVSESLMMVRLNTSRILHTRLNWRPQMLNELKVTQVIMRISRAY